jgi:hypothetical protein
VRQQFARIRHRLAKHFSAFEAAAEETFNRAYLVERLSGICVDRQSFARSYGFVFVKPGDGTCNVSKTQRRDKKEIAGTYYER